jgi:hypothetical protein
VWARRERNLVKQVRPGTGRFRKFGPDDRTKDTQPCTWANGSIDLSQERLPTLRSLVLLDCSATSSDRTGMVAILLIAVCYAAGLAVHYHWYAPTAALSLSFDRSAGVSGLFRYRASSPLHPQAAPNSPALHRAI